jgi:hypothetical protein
MQITYGCGDTPLEKSRYMKFKKQAAKGKIDPDRLPPTMQQLNIPFVSIFKLWYGSILTPLFLIPKEEDGS